MIFYILILVIFVLAYLGYRFSDREERWSTAIGSFCFSVIFAGVILALFTSFSDWAESERVRVSLPIFSLKTDEKLSGSFFLGIGQIKGEEKYYYFSKDSRGGFYKESKPTSNCFIFENDSVKPNIAWEIITYQCPSWVIPFSLNKKLSTKADITVPIGTIFQKFEVN